MKTLEEFVARARDTGKVVITAHINADPDAVASAALLGYILQLKGLKVEYCFDSISGLSKKILESLGVKLEPRIEPTSGRFYPLIICDTASPQLLGKCGALLQDAREKLVIDHHGVKGVQWDTNYIIIEPKEPATTVIAAHLAKKITSALPGRLATLAMAGILYDTRRFLETTHKTFQVMEWLYPQGDYTLSLKLLSGSPSRSERIAKLKGAARAGILDVCGYIVAVSRVSSYEAAVARALINLGADIAVVVGGSGLEVRASLRASKRLLEKGLNLEAVLGAVSSTLGGAGGGHPGAAGYNYRASDKKAAGAARSRTAQTLLTEIIRSILSGLC